MQETGCSTRHCELFYLVIAIDSIFLQSFITLKEIQNTTNYFICSDWAANRQLVSTDYDRAKRTQLSSIDCATMRQTFHTHQICNDIRKSGQNTTKKRVRSSHYQPDSINHKAWETQLIHIT
jgi:hypothetical protein